MARPSDRFLQTITYASVTARDAWGGHTLGTQSTAAARVQPTRQFVQDAAGESVQARYLVYTQAVLTTTHRVWVLSESVADAQASHRVLRIDESCDGNAVVQFRQVWLA